LVQKSEAWRQTGSPVRTYFHAIQTMRSPRPIEIGGKMKWKLAVRANWSRDRNSGFTSPSFPLYEQHVGPLRDETTGCVAEHHTNGMIPRI
jgi:hypothetical protein